MMENVPVIGQYYHMTRFPGYVVVQITQNGPKIYGIVVYDDDPVVRRRIEGAVLEIALGDTLVHLTREEITMLQLLNGD